MSVPIHARTHDRSIEGVQGGEKRRRAVAFIVVSHGRVTAGLNREARLRTIERLDLALFVNAKHDGVFGRIDV